ncbi:MAG: RDD family protein, partial [Chitinophagales bacterium]|nr:RDD family protein [Chitinophagales bacterium]
MEPNQILDADLQQQNFHPQEIIASAGMRFVNYLIDVVCFYVLIIITFFILGMLQLITNAESPIIYVITFTILFLFYFGFEARFGKTPAKFITRTRVVNKQGNLPTAGSIALRTLSRFVPFEPFS